MANFNTIYGYSFPFEKLSCRTCMDYFRLYPALFKLDNPFSTNSIINIITPKENMPSIGSTNFRKNFINASIFNEDSYLLNWNKVDYEFVSSNQDQDPEENIDNTSLKSIEMDVTKYDSNMIKESMKEKMRNVLTKYANGISCNEFLDIYAEEYYTFTFCEYGFKSMKDMAYQLPSVFYVKVVEDECILFHANKRSELENVSNDSTLFYKNIPKTILHNLSELFDQNRNGIIFDELKTLYCSMYGRPYEPLKYGYDSEIHMFQSLNKMVEIQNNIVYTKDHSAYLYFENHENSLNNSNYDAILTDNNFLKKYSGNDICNGKFEYPKFKFSNGKIIKVVVAEVYSLCSFYIQMASNVNMLNTFMGNLQEFYNKNEDQYKIKPEFITPGLVCTSRFEDKEWHRGIILKLADENSVQVLYVDYGSIEKISKSRIRLLKSEFGNLPIQALHCCLFSSNQNYSREVNEAFADIVDNNILEARFNGNILKSNDKKMTVTLYLTTVKERININKKFLNKIIKQVDTCQGSIRRTITTLLQDDENNHENVRHEE